MTKKLWRTWVGIAALAACGLVGATVAAGAGSAAKTSSTTTTTTTTTGHRPEAPLTGDVLATVKAAAVAKIGGTVDSATTENDSSNAAATYEAHVTKPDGSHVTVILDTSYNVLAVETGHARGHDRGGHGRGGSGETTLTGDVAAEAEAAAVAKVGGTADRATNENDSSNAAAAYEVHVTKTDGTHVTVILDETYAVLSVETHSPRPGH